MSTVDLRVDALETGMYVVARHLKYVLDYCTKRG